MRTQKCTIHLLSLFFLLVCVVATAFGADQKSLFNPKAVTRPERLEKIFPRLLPDLTVTDLQAKDDPQGCVIQVTARNLGPGFIPDRYYHDPPDLAFQMYRDNKPWGGIVIYGVDPQKALQKPGGALSFDWFPGAQNLRLHPGYHTLKIVADVHKKLAESNENNNIFIKRVSCGCKVPLPKPIIKFHHRDQKGRAYIPVVNWAQFSDDLFAQAPYLPPCGLNKNASRTWVDIYDADTNRRIYGFCALGKGQNLQNIWVLPPKNVKRVYIVVKDRACHRSNRSNVITLP